MSKKEGSLIMSQQDSTKLKKNYKNEIRFDKEWKLRAQLDINHDNEKHNELNICRKNIMVNKEEEKS